MRKLMAKVLGVVVTSASCSLVLVGIAGGSVAGATTPTGPEFNVIINGAVGFAGVPFTYPVGFQVVGSLPESQPVTVTVGPSGLASGETLVSVPTPSDPNWNCSGSDIAQQTVVCVYTPTAGSPIQPGTPAVLFDLPVVFDYQTVVEQEALQQEPVDQDIAYAVGHSPDGSNSSNEVTNVDLLTDGVALNLGLIDTLASPSAAVPGATFDYQATVSVGETMSGAPAEGQPITYTDTLPAGVVLTGPPSAPSGSGWDCSASNVAASTVSCANTPPAGGIAQNTVLPTITEPARLAANTAGQTLTNNAAAASSDTGGATASDVVTVVSSDSTPPTVTGVTATPALTTLGNGTTLSATVADAEAGGTNVTSAQYNVNGGTWLPMSGAFGSASVNVTATIPPPSAPVADTVCVRGEDGAGNWSDGTTCVSFVVYDPSAGFVTGGGWITSPAGACLDPTVCGANATGQANFGFVSKYQKGASVPSGNTQYVFHAGSLNFSSSTYQWLIVNRAGSNAQFKGTGTINGAGNYTFMIWATQGSPNTFRIQITNANTGATVYDTATQALGGGSIIVHTS